MSDLRRCLDEMRKGNDPKIRKYSSYLNEYEKRFERYRSAPATVLEIGVQHGGSLELWRKYFGPEAQIYGIDIIPECRKLETPRTKILIGDQSDPEFLAGLDDQLPELDIIIDDGSHVPWQQVATFEHLFYSKLKDGGVYVVEDCHTSYWSSHGGGLRKRGTFIEYAKRLIDEVNAWHAGHPGNPVTRTTRSVASISFSCSVVFIEKSLVDAPVGIELGRETIDVARPFPRHGAILSRLKGNAWVRNIVRRNKALWLIARRVMRN